MRITVLPLRHCICGTHKAYYVHGLGLVILFKIGTTTSDACAKRSCSRIRHRSFDDRREEQECRTK